MFFWLIVSFLSVLSAAELSFKSAVMELKSPWIYMHDVVECVGDVCDEAQGILLGHFNEREQLYMDQDHVSKILRSELPDSTFVWQESPVIRCELKAIKTAISIKDLEQIIQLKIAQFLPEHIKIDEWRILAKEAILIWPDSYRVHVPDFDQQRFSDLFWIQERFLRQRQLGVEILQNDRVISKVYLPYRAKFLVQVPVARNALRKTHILKTEDSEYQWLNLSQRSRDEVFIKEDLVGLELKRDVALGEPLSKRFLKKQILIKRGEMVDAQVISEGLAVRVKAKSLEHAGAGDKVRVFIPSTKKTLSGVLKSDSQVEIRL
jgi:flagella basal body P-ring formation protein FlgA